MENIKSIANNGMSKPAFKRFENNKYKPWDVKSFGFKANLSDINASLLKDQILNYKKLSNTKKTIYIKLKKRLSNLKQIKFPSNLKNNDSSFTKYKLLKPKPLVGMRRVRKIEIDIIEIPNLFVFLKPFSLNKKISKIININVELKIKISGNAKKNPSIPIFNE